MPYYVSKLRFICKKYMFYNKHHVLFLYIAPLFIFLLYNLMPLKYLGII